MPKRRKILCAMSGGVDSSVAALLLRRKGFEVIGVFMNFWNEDKDKSNICCSAESAGLARMVAKKLNIKLYSLNYKELFKKKVVDYYLKGHERGTTPNPCVICNREVKFKKIIILAQNLGARQIATGHYARIVKKDHRLELHRGQDKKKDQSYFLWQLERQDLPKILFPIGNLTKKQVRKIAEKNNLATYNKKDSQGLCFVGESKAKFLKKYAKKLLEPGNVVDRKNNIIGRHKGLAFYTIGQRAGFLVTKDQWRKSKLDVPPLYVIKLIPEKNILLVGKNKDILQKEFIVSGLNWLNNSYRHFTGSKKVHAQIRYQHPAVSCHISYINNQVISARFIHQQRAITPGQSCVFYQGDEVLGGGFIEK